jgi:hypothetical protein
MSEIKVFKNTTAIFPLTFKRNGEPINITGQTILFTVKRKLGGAQDDSDALILKNITDHTTPLEGKTTLTLTPSDLNIHPGTYLVDFKRIDGDAVVGYDYMDFIVKQTVTQRN